MSFLFFFTVAPCCGLSWLSQIFSAEDYGCLNRDYVAGKGTVI